MDSLVNCVTLVPRTWLGLLLEELSGSVLSEAAGFSEEAGGQLGSGFFQVSDVAACEHVLEIFSRFVHVLKKFRPKLVPGDVADLITICLQLVRT